MPNWCYNTVTITSDNKERLEEFNHVFSNGKDAVYRGDTKNNDIGYRFNAIVPVPPEVLAIGYSPTHTLDAKEEILQGLIKSIEKEHDLDTKNRLKEILLGISLESIDPNNLTGYHWQSENWGTKWDIGEDCYVHFDPDDSLSMDFDTAWGPPLAFFEQASEKYPDLTFEISFIETGMGFAGRSAFRDGETIEKAEADSNSSTFKEDLHRCGFNYEDFYDDEDEEENE